MNNERMNIFIAKVELSKEVAGEENTIFHKFASREAIDVYLRNNSRYILNFEIVKTYAGLTFEEFNNLWFKVLKTPCDIEKSLAKMA